ncbi:proteasome regulatory particle base subunit [Phlyctochytrium planicorne]|nr:proteasome regulatory particle base subunit [Phlyctochytrium planicorne]
MYFVRTIVFVVVFLAALAAGNPVKTSTLRVFTSEKKEKLTLKASFPNRFKDAAVVENTDTVKFSVDLSEGDIQYTLLFLRSVTVDKEVTVYLEKSGNVASVSLDPASAAIEAIRNYPGDYSVSVIAVDSKSKHAPLELGTITFNTIKKSEGSEESYSTLPLIDHKFRQPEKTPNAVLSYIFAVLVVAPWAFLLLLWSSLKVNASNLFSSFSTMFWGSAFIVALGLSLVHFGVYWVQLTLFEFLGYGFPVWILTLVTGRQALVAHAVVRLEDEAAEKKK